MNKNIAGIFLCAALLPVQGAVLGIYEFAGDPPNPQVTAQPSGAAFGSMTRNNVSYDSQQNRFTSIDWALGTSIDLTKYVQFVLTPDAGEQLNLTQIVFDSKRGSGGGAGPRDARVSIFIGANTTEQASMDFAPASNAFDPVTFDFSDFSTTSAVTIRFYGWNPQGGHNGPLGFDDIQTEGSITPVPEPIGRALACSAFAYMGLQFVCRLRRKSRSGCFA